MKTPYAICRTQKLHFKDLAKMARHNFRDAQVVNADASKIILPLRGEKSGKAFVQAVTQRFETWKARKLAEPRTKRGARMARDPVVCVEILLTASPEYFRPQCVERAGYWEPARTQAWQSTVEKFAQDYFGERLVSLVVHFDESTPHIHLLTVPTDDKGEFNAKKMFNRANLIRLQDAYAEACKPLGLQRGLRGSKAQHQEIKDFYGVINTATPEANPQKLKPRGPRLPSKIERLDDDKLKAYAASVFREGAKAASIIYEKKLESVAAKASAYDLAQRAEVSASHALEEARRLANEVRTIPLPDVLAKLGAIQDATDSSVWNLPGRSLSVRGSKFFDRLTPGKGTGAIDLVKHCEGVDYRQAVAWLALEFGKQSVIGEAIRVAREQTGELAESPQPLPLPLPSPEHLPAVERLLTQECRLPSEMIQPLIESGKLYADQFGNCVFKLKTLAGDAGAEIQGLGAVPIHTFRGHGGFFVLPPSNRASKQAVLVSSALDALCHRALRPLCGWIFSVACMAVREVRKLARQLKEQGFAVTSAFNRGREGEQLAESIQLETGNSTREQPEAGSWHDLLQTRKPSIGPRTQPAPSVMQSPKKRLRL